tara:strand:- start:5719 stop:7053 length:1335 start_codon:yes stop_codon:yes gene_type:complete
MSNFIRFSEYLKEAKGEMTFVFGRFNPPTTGHEKLFEQLKKASGGSYRIYASKSQDPKKNPLTFKQKIKFLRKIFPKHARSIMADNDVRTVLDIATKLYDQGYTKVNMVAGSDRVKEFSILLNKYNGVKSRHGFYEFKDQIKVVSAGDRDPDAEGVTGMSASKMRAAAADNDMASFAKGLPKNVDPKELFLTVRKGMGLKEQKIEIKLDPVSEKREEYVEGKLFNVGDIVALKETNDVGTIKVCGSNYLIVEFGEWKKRVWLDKVDLLENCGGVGEPGVTKKYKNTTPGETVSEDDEKLKGGYYKGIKAKSTKQARKRHFDKGAEMDDDNPNAYKKAPGDATAKTKPSKHTKKYQQMFGELKFEDFDIEEGKSDAALKKKADKSGMPLAILRKVFNRGVAAWRTGHRPGTTPTQWGLARVNSFVTKSSGTWGKADKDLAAKVRG